LVRVTVAHVVRRTDADLSGTRPRTPAEEAKACRCGHVALAHEHYRRGTDCAVCECRKYRRRPRGGFFRRG
jgi:hypothetical protein